MKLNEYQELSKRTMPKPLAWYRRIKVFIQDKEKVNYIMGLSGETGEFIDLIEKRMVS
jgi:hypothetical protein